MLDDHGNQFEVLAELVALTCALLFLVSMEGMIRWRFDEHRDLSSLGVDVVDGDGASATVNAAAAFGIVHHTSPIPDVSSSKEGECWSSRPEAAFVVEGVPLEVRHLRVLAFLVEFMEPFETVLHVRLYTMCLLFLLARERRLRKTRFPFLQNALGYDPHRYR